MKFEINEILFMDDAALMADSVMMMDASLLDECWMMIL